MPVKVMRQKWINEVIHEFEPEHIYWKIMPMVRKHAQFHIVCDHCRKVVKGGNIYANVMTPGDQSKFPSLTLSANLA